MKASYSNKKLCARDLQVNHCGSLPQMKAFYPNKKLCARDPQIEIFWDLYIGHCGSLRVRIDL